MTWRYLSYEYEKALQQVLALTSVDNEAVRELRLLLAGEWPPRLIQTTVIEDDEEIAVLECPHCGAKHATGADEEEGIAVVDLQTRSSTFYYDAGNNRITGYYNDDGGGYETYTYECEACGKDVRLPIGITEDGDY